MTAAVTLGVSFWHLMYSRVGLRHISTPVLLVLTFYFLWLGYERMGNEAEGADWGWAFFGGAGIWMGLNFLTYFAARGVPVIIVAWAIYLTITGQWGERGVTVWRRVMGVGVCLVLGLLLGVPLWWQLQMNPGAEARVAELAAPLTALREGDPSLVLEHIYLTMSMFTHYGDEEWLYNVPERPLFDPVLGVLFWVGVVVTAYHAWWRPRLVEKGWRRRWPPAGGALLGLWLVAGLSPAFLSVPPASLGHTILAQPAVYMLLAVPVVVVHSWWGERMAWVAMVVVVSGVAVRDLPDYFVEWPERGQVRFLYRAEIDEVARYWAERVEAEEATVPSVAVASLLAGPWDQEAFELGWARYSDRPLPLVRWYQPEKAIFVEPRYAFYGYPEVGTAFGELFVLERRRWGGYQLGRHELASLPEENEICFENGLCWRTGAYVGPSVETGGQHGITVGWGVERPLDLPPFKLVSNPPPPGVDARPRLSSFVHFYDIEGNFVGGADGLWVDPYRLAAGDQFLQKHGMWLGEGVVVTEVRIGLYDPQTGERVKRVDGGEWVVVHVQ